MSDENEPTITRAQLVAAVELAIGKTAGLSDEDTAKLRGTAATMPTVAVDAWRIGTCGCVVGVAFDTGSGGPTLKPELRTERHRMTALHIAGLNINDAINDVIQADFGVLAVDG